MLIKMDWIQKINIIVINGKMEFNILKNEILEWLKDLKKVFGTILERELLLHYDGVDYEIILKTEKIKFLSLIFIRSKK